MEKLTISDFKAIIASATETITAQGEELSKMDAALGDGDHGEAIVTAMKVVSTECGKMHDFKVGLGDMGFGVMLQTSGSTSTLLGGFWLGMSDALGEGLVELSLAEVRSMFVSALAGVRKNTKADVGDKTMMDALIPAVAAMEAYSGEDIKEMFTAASAAAQAGAASTVDMVAKFGRARNFGEKCIGHVDAGATSWSMLIDSFATTI
ncbi:MAG: DAK2 domain-containing protein [Rikenellaceae bacterium]